MPGGIPGARREMRVPQQFTHTRSVTKKMKTDPQQHLLRNLERELVGSSLYTKTDLDCLRAILKHACRKYKVPEAKLRVFNSSKELVYGYCVEDGVHLNAGHHGVNLFTMLHELAHWITDFYHGGDLAAHGPEFVGIYSELLDRYKLIPSDAFAVLCRRHKVKANFDRGRKK